MKKLDWYILKKMLSTFVFTILVITVIAVVIDTSEKADDFVKSGLTSWQIVTHYFAGFVPFIMAMIFPLMVFIAVIYFSSKMAGQSEFVAILAGGVRYNRMLRPYKPTLPMTVTIRMRTMDAAAKAAMRNGMARLGDHTVEARVGRQCDIVKWINGTGLDMAP